MTVPARRAWFIAWFTVVAATMRPVSVHAQFPTDTPDPTPTAGLPSLIGPGESVERLATGFQFTGLYAVRMALRGADGPYAWGSPTPEPSATAGATPIPLPVPAPRLYLPWSLRRSG
ncbi:MAG: hypothetical protein IT332_09770 [Ardenticatenales bacterium]|nr:hypothetical protein [Ardenticatenales bacterium]